MSDERAYIEATRYYVARARSTPIRRTVHNMARGLWLATECRVSKRGDIARRAAHELFMWASR